MINGFAVRCANALQSVPPNLCEWDVDVAYHIMASKIKSGTVCVNNHNYVNPAWPFGGFKQSGWGREMGKEGIEHYTETKSIAVKL